MSRVNAPSLSLAALVCFLVPGTGGEPTPSAAWELRLLGVGVPHRLKQLRMFPKRRRVRLAIVGQNGVSRRVLGRLIGGQNRILYHDCQDPGSNTHDTQMSRVILEITQPLGVEVDLHVWQAGPSLQDYADKFRRAATMADVVSLYQSFWGNGVPVITKGIREASTALFISPYVEHGGHPTNSTPQGSASQSWKTGTIAHFVTVAPLPRQHQTEMILQPSDRGPTDSEAINFIAPSYHARGPGGTCPSAAVAVACALYLYAVYPDEPSPSAIISLMRETSTIDQKVLASKHSFSDSEIDLLRKQVSRLRHPLHGRQRKLDAPGLLNLDRAHRRLAEAREKRD